jgi:hypothetical protein
MAAPVVDVESVTAVTLSFLYFAANHWDAGIASGHRGLGAHLASIEAQGSVAQSRYPGATAPIVASRSFVP